MAKLTQKSIVVLLSATLFVSVGAPAICAQALVPTISAQAAGSDSAGWQTLSVPSNPISIQYPPGWSATTDGQSGRIDLKNDSGSSLSVLPFFIANQTMEGLGPKQFFNTFIKAFAPNEAWSEPESVGANSFRATFTNNTESAAAALVLYQSQKGVSGQVCIAKTPKGAQAVGTDTFVQMLSSLKYNVNVAPASQFNANSAAASASGGAGSIAGGGSSDGSSGTSDSDDEDDEADGGTGAQAVTTEAQGATQDGGTAAAPAGEMPGYMPGIPMGGAQVPSQMQGQDAAQGQDPMQAAQEMAFQQQGNASGLPATTFSGWTRFNDPTENCFWVDVPAGWKIDGGLTRTSAIDTRPWVKAVSPDDLITAFVGDGKITPFTMPTGTLNTLGFRPGRVVNGSVVANYMPARKFVEYYARTNMKKLFTDVQVVEEHDHPDVAASMNGTVGCSRSEAASIKLTAMYGNIPVVAYYLASTKATVGYGTGMWWVTMIAGEVSPADRDKAGLSVILRMISSFTINPVWKGESLKTTAAVSQNYRAASQQISRSISDRYWSQQAANDRMNQSYWNRQASQDRAANNFSNSIRGVENVQDTATGTQYQVQSGPQYHYIDPTGNYYAGSDHSAPGPEWRQLMAVP